LLIRTNKVMDVLSDILRKVKISSAVYFKYDFSSPWGMDVPKASFAKFHILTRGQCILKLKNKLIRLYAGDIVVLPLGTEHWLADLESSERKMGQEVMDCILSGKSIFEGDKIAATLICGHVKFDNSIDHPFIKELPEIIHITNYDKKELSWLESILNLVIQEAGVEKSGSNIIVNKLAEVMFIFVLRAFIQRKTSEIGFLAAIQDERMSKVLKAIHTSPEKDWQLFSLAQLAGMSRTGFSNKFKSLTGDTPLNYITQWRILHAQELLKESNKSVGEIAEMVGYQSEAAFNRVFKKRVTQTPLKYRQSVLASRVG